MNGINAKPVEPGTPAPAGAPRILDKLLDLELPVALALGSTDLSLKDVLRMRSGSVIELDKEVGQEVELRVHGTLVACGEIVLVNENYGIRITRIAAGRSEPLLSGDAA